MLSNIIIGIVFFCIIAFAGKKAYSDIKNKRCSSCGGSCSDKSKCSGCN